MAQRIHRGDAQQIGHQGVGGRAPPLAANAPLAGKADDIPDDEKIAGQPHPLDDGQFVVHLRPGLACDRAEPAGQSLLAQMAQVALRSVTFRHGEGRQALRGKIEAGIAPLGNAEGIAQRLGELGKEGGHLPGRFEVTAPSWDATTPLPTLRAGWRGGGCWSGRRVTAGPTARHSGRCWSPPIRCPVPGPGRSAPAPVGRRPAGNGVGPRSRSARGQRSRAVGPRLARDRALPHRLWPAALQGSRPGGSRRGRSVPGHARPMFPAPGGAGLSARPVARR